MADYQSLGSDFDRSSGDLTPDMRLLSTPTGEIAAWLQNLAENMQTPRGALWYDKDYGLDLRSYVADDEEPAVAAHEINQTLLKDERTGRATTDITVGTGGRWQVASTVVNRQTGQAYTLTFKASAESVALLGISDAIA